MRTGYKNKKKKKKPQHQTKHPPLPPHYSDKIKQPPEHN